MHQQAVGNLKKNERYIVRKEPINVKNAEKIIPIGQKIDIFVRDGDFEGIYSSYIYDMDEKYIYILLPTNKNGLNAYIRRGEVFDISFIDSKERRVGFSTKLVDVIKEEDDKTIYKVEKPKEVFYRIELRESFRVDILTESEIMYFKNAIPRKNKATIIDISAGGAKLSANIELATKLNIGDKVFLSFELDDNMKLENIEAKVVRKAIAKENGLHHYGLQFINLDKDTKEKLIKFCINKQLEFVRKMRGL